MFWMCCSIKAANVQWNLQRIQIISADYMQTNMVIYKCAQVVQAVWVGCRQPGGWERGASTWEYMGAQVGSMVGCRAQLDTTALGLRKDPRSLVYSPSPSLGMRRKIWFLESPNFSDLSQTSQLSVHLCLQPLLAWIIRQQQTTSSHVNQSNLQAP